MRRFILELAVLACIIAINVMVAGCLALYGNAFVIIQLLKDVPNR